MKRNKLLQISHFVMNTRSSSKQKWL